MPSTASVIPMGSEKEAPSFMSSALKADREIDSCWPRHRGSILCIPYRLVRADRSVYNGASLPTRYQLKSHKYRALCNMMCDEDDEELRAAAQETVGGSTLIRQHDSGHDSDCGDVELLV